MSRNLFRFFLVISSIALPVSGVRALDDYPLFHTVDSLAPRDEWGVLHQMAHVRPTDYAYRESFRPNYYWRSGRSLLNDPAYVAALQVCLRNRGYYCGPIDGYYTEAVSEAIARMQKNFTLPVTGTLTVAVRRGLHLP